MPDNTGQTIRRTLAVMRTISTFRGEWFTLGKLADKLGFAPSTAFRYLQVFVEEGILEKSELVVGHYRYKRPEQG